MCDSRYSHKLFDEEQEYLGKTYSKHRHTKANLSSIYPHLKDMKFIKFTGGEPLIIKDHWTLLEYAVEHDYAKNIRLNYSTNCTVWPKKRIVDIWKQFDYIELAISLDSIMPQENEYQRHLTNHSQALANIEKYVEIADEVGININARPTITIYNAYHLPETLEWLWERNIKINSHFTVGTLEALFGPKFRIPACFLISYLYDFLVQCNILIFCPHFRAVIKFLPSFSSISSIFRHFHFRLLLLHLILSIAIFCYY